MSSGSLEVSLSIQSIHLFLSFPLIGYQTRVIYETNHRHRDLKYRYHLGVDKLKYDELVTILVERVVLPNQTSAIESKSTHLASLEIKCLRFSQSSK